MIDFYALTSPNVQNRRAAADVPGFLVEYVRPLDDYDQIAARFFSPLMVARER